MEFGKFLYAPFGKSMISKSKLNVEQNKLWKTYSTLVMVIYLSLGILLFLVSVVQAALLCITIFGLPMAVIVAKSLSTYLNPVNKKCAHHAVTDELDRQKGAIEIQKHLGE